MPPMVRLESPRFVSSHQDHSVEKKSFSRFEKGLSKSGFLCYTLGFKPKPKDLVYRSFKFLYKPFNFTYRPLSFSEKAYGGELKSFWGYAKKLGTSTKKALGIKPESFVI